MLEIENAPTTGRFQTKSYKLNYTQHTMETNNNTEDIRVETDHEHTPVSERKEVVPVGQVFSNFPTQAEWNTMNMIAQTLKMGGVLPKGIDTVQKMVVVLQAGREIGLAPMESLNSLYFVNGKVAMYGEAVPNQIMRAGHRIKWGKCDATQAEVTIIRGDNGDQMTTKFTMEEAEKRGYTSNPIYKKFPENMLKWRALSMTAKFIAPDALRGIGIKEDMEVEVVDDGGKFHNAEEAKRVKGEAANGTLSKRPSLDESIGAADAKVEPVAKKKAK
jgi:hypothetical protein